MQINRLFETVYLLLDKKKMTASELAQHFGVSRRTICRDIDILSTAGIPIYSQRGKAGGIHILPDFVLNKSILTPTEQEEILNALSGLSNLMTEESSKVLQKLSTLFCKNTENWLEIDFTGWSYEDDFFNSIKRAILQKKVLAFSYYNRYGEKTPRRVEPVQLWFKSRTWYLKAFCQTKQAMRLYKLACIKNLRVTEEVFTIRAEMNGEEKTAHNFFATEPLVPITLHIAKERAFRVFEDFHQHMAEKQPDGSFIVKAEWPEDTWLYGFILSFGRHIQVLEPPHLRKIIFEEAQILANNHR